MILCPIHSIVKSDLINNFQVSWNIIFYLKTNRNAKYSYGVIYKSTAWMRIDIDYNVNGVPRSWQQLGGPENTVIFIIILEYSVPFI